MGEAARRFNRAAVLGPLIALAGLVRHFTLFYRWAELRDVPWASYALLALALILSARGVVLARRRGGGLRRGLAALGLVVSAGLALVFRWFVTAGSRAACRWALRCPFWRFSTPAARGSSLPRSSSRSAAEPLRAEGTGRARGRDLHGLRRGEPPRGRALRAGVPGPLRSRPRRAARLRRAARGRPPDGSDIARPATFIFDGGTLRWRDLTENYRIRPRPGTLLAELGRIRAARDAVP